MELPYDPEAPSWAYTQGKPYPEKTRTPVFRAALFTAARTREQPQGPPTDDGVEKTGRRHAADCFSAVKKSEAIDNTLLWLGWVYSDNVRVSLETGTTVQRKRRERLAVHACAKGNAAVTHSGMNPIRQVHCP